MTEYVPRCRTCHDYGSVECPDCPGLIGFVECDGCVTCRGEGALICTDCPPRDHQSDPHQPGEPDHVPHALP